MKEMADVAIVGAGPYGLSIAAHLLAQGLDVRVFGSPMRTWRVNMPKGMMLKSEGFASSLSDPGDTFTLGHYCRDQGIPYDDIGRPVPVEVFASYGEAFQRRFVPNLDTRPVAKVARDGDGFSVETAAGKTVSARRLVVATGIGAYARVPAELQALPASALTHSCHHADYTRFAGQDVAVIGAGASALDAAAALRRAGARATLVTRRSTVRFYEPGRPRRAIDALLRPVTPLGPGWKKWLCCELPLLFHALPERTRLAIVRRYLGPSPGWHVRDTIEGHVPYCLDSTVAGATLSSDGRVSLAIDRVGHGRLTLEVDHVVAATGYKVEVERLKLLASDLIAGIDTLDGSPVLSRNFESSVPACSSSARPRPIVSARCSASLAARITRRGVSRDASGPCGQPRAGRGRKPTRGTEPARGARLKRHKDRADDPT